MALWPKKRFEWREPREFRRVTNIAAQSEDRWWHRPLMALAFAVLLLVCWATAHLDPDKQPPPFPVAVTAALPTGFFLVYVLAWLTRAVPSEVKIDDKRLIRVSGGVPVECQFKDVTGYMVRQYGDFRVLVLGLRNRTQFLVGVPIELDLGALERFFSDRGMHPAAIVAEWDVRSPAEDAVASFEGFLHQARSR